MVFVGHCPGAEFELVRDLLGRSPADLGELVAQSRPRHPRRGCEEVGHRALERVDREQRREVESGGLVRHQLVPRLVVCASALVDERAYGSERLPDRRAREPHGQQLLRTTDQEQRHVTEKIRAYANHSPPAQCASSLWFVIAPNARLSYRDALASRELRALLAAQLVSVGGLSIAAVALTILVYRRTASPLLASLTFALSFLPYLLGAGLLSGLVDRVRPRALVVACDSVSALLMAAIAWPGLLLPILFALLLAIGTLSSVSSGARAALVRSSVPADAYVTARSLLRIAAQLAQIGGNAGGGALLVVLSPSGALLVSAATFLCSASTIRLGLADHPHTGERGEARLLRDSLSGARQILAHAELRRLLLVGWLAPMFAVAPEALAAPYVAGHHGSSATVGWWLVALPIGLIAGDFAGVRLLSAQQQRRLVAPAAALGFIPYVAFILNPPIPAAMALLVASGASGLYALGLDARVRDAAPPQLFARTMTLSTGGLMALQGIGFTLAGGIGQAVGPATAIAIAGGCGLAITVGLLHQDLRLPQQLSRETVQ